VTSSELDSAATLARETLENLGARLSRILTAADEETLGVAAETCLEQLCRYGRLDRGFVIVFDQYERIAEQWSWDALGRPFDRPPVGSGIEDVSGSAAAFLRIGKTVAVGDMAALELGPAEVASLRRNGGVPAARMMLPVMLGTDVIGLVGLQSLQEKKGWSAGFILEMEGFAQMLVRMLGRTRNRQALATANARARRIAAHLPDGLLMLTTDSVIAWVSPSFLAMAGKAADELVRRSLAELVSPSDRVALLDGLAALEPGTDAALAVRMADRHGRWRWADLSLRLASEPELGVPDEIMVTVRDTHERHLREQRLVRESDRDPLTGLANRGAFDRFVAELSSGDAAILVAFCDIDNFKACNDGLGHDTGDDVLCRVARALESSVRSRDMLARFGGDEFVLIVVDAGQEASVLGQRLTHAVRAASPENGPALTMSVGVCGPGPARDVRRMLRLSDEAMYAAKRAGKDHWVHTNLGEG
jgi:diguanylate cyclase (GGDEF)-like protein/PAS domain S-box-containing protein